jgi:hypothetical protein
LMVKKPSLHRGSPAQSRPTLRISRQEVFHVPLTKNDREISPQKSCPGKTSPRARTE